MVLYKYSKAKWGMKSLVELRLRVTPPNEFNDPFEFTPTAINPIASLDPKALMPLSDALSNEGIQSPIESLQKVLPVLKETNSMIKSFPEALVSADMSACVNAGKHFGVLCLSEKPISIRMWSHYGDDHRGVAIGVELDDEIPRLAAFVHFGKVKYRENRPVRDPLISGGLEFHKQMLETTMTKSEVWIDEEEHRLILRLKKLQREPRGDSEPPLFDYFIHLQPETIREVVLGCFVSDRDAETITDLLKAKLPHVKLYHLKRHDTEFKMVLAECPLNDPV